LTISAKQTKQKKTKLLFVLGDNIAHYRLYHLDINIGGVMQPEEPKKGSCEFFFC